VGLRLLQRDAGCRAGVPAAAGSPPSRSAPPSRALWHPKGSAAGKQGSGDAGLGCTAGPARADAGQIKSGTELVPIKSGTELVPIKSGTELVPVKSGTEFVPIKSGTELVPVKSGTEFVPIKSGTELVPIKSGTELVPGKSGTEPVPIKSGTELVPVKSGTEFVPVQSGTELRWVPADSFLPGASGNAMCLDRKGRKYCPQALQDFAPRRAAFSPIASSASGLARQGPVELLPGLVLRSPLTD